MSAANVIIRVDIRHSLTVRIADLTEEEIERFDMDDYVEGLLVEMQEAGRLTIVADEPDGVDFEDGDPAMLTISPIDEGGAA